MRLTTASPYCRDGLTHADLEFIADAGRGECRIGRTTIPGRRFSAKVTVGGQSVERTGATPGAAARDAIAASREKAA